VRRAESKGERREISLPSAKGLTPALTWQKTGDGATGRRGDGGTMTSVWVPEHGRGALTVTPSVRLGGESVPQQIRAHTISVVSNPIVTPDHTNRDSDVGARPIAFTSRIGVREEGLV
jgi:hypothetical protein